MKNKILGIVVPALAAVAVIGTGFATWQFTENGASASIGAKLEGYTNLGDITIANAEYATLNLDSSDDQGIRLVYGTGASGATDDQVDFSLSVTTDSNRQESLTLTTQITFGDELGAYIDITAETYKDGSSLNNSQSGNGASTLTITDTLTTDGTSTSETFSLSTHLSFEWATDKEPSSVSEWSTLNGIVSSFTSGGALTITYSVDYSA